MIVLRLRAFFSYEGRFIFHFFQTYVNVADIIIRIKKTRITVERIIRSEYLLFNSPSTNAVVSFCSLTSDKAPPSLFLVMLN
jgi:hypothetical protein